MSETKIDSRDAERMMCMLQQIKRDVSQLETMLTLLKPASLPASEEDIFAEMAGLTANAPHADDSREAIYTRMPDE